MLAVSQLRVTMPLTADCPPADGTTTLHALGELQVRGTLFIGTHSATYNGMIIGESARESDMEVRTPLLRP